jgi:hypothetical protein
MQGDKCRAVYVHWDGYLDGVGRELQSYTTQAEVEELISHGDRSSLEDGYYKDRGEKGVEPTDYDTFAEFLEAVEGCWAEFYYIFKDGTWYCGNTYGGSELYMKLTAYEDAVAKQEAEVE